MIDVIGKVVCDVDVGNRVVLYKRWRYEHADDVSTAGDGRGRGNRVLHRVYLPWVAG